MEKHLKAHEQQRMQQNVVVKKIIQKGSVVNIEESLFFQGLKTPKRSIFSKLFGKQKPRLILINYDFFSTISLLPNSLRMGKVKSVLPFKRLFQIRKTVCIAHS